MEKVKLLMNAHYEENMKDSFYGSDVAKSMENNEYISGKDWETAFFVWHRPNSNIVIDLTTLSQELQ